MISISRLLILSTFFLFSCQDKKNYKGDFFVVESSWRWDEVDSTLTDYLNYDVHVDLKQNILLWEKTVISTFSIDVFNLKLGLTDDYQIDSFLNWKEFKLKYKEIVDRMIESIPEEQKTEDFNNIIENIALNDSLIKEKNTKDCQLFLKSYAYLDDSKDFSDWKITNHGKNVVFVNYSIEIPHVYLSDYANLFEKLLTLSETEVDEFQSYFKVEFAVNKKLHEIIFIKEIREIFYQGKIISRDEMYIQNTKKMDVLYEMENN